MVLKLVYIDSNVEYIKVKKVLIKSNNYDGTKHIAYIDPDGREYQLIVGRPYQASSEYTLFRPDYYGKLTSPEPLGQTPLHTIVLITLNGEEIYNIHKRNIIKG